MSDPTIAGTCLVLMLKAPERSKRRLAAEIGAQALAAAEALSACALEDMRDWPGCRCYAPAEAADGDWLDGRDLPDGERIPQHGGNLGARINHVNRELNALGRTTQLFIGIDCPQLNLPYLERAARALERHDAVFGPAADGGVVLMGARRAWPDLDALPWSTSELYALLRASCERSGWSIAELEPLADVDTLADLAASAQRLAQDPRPARRALREWLDGVLGTRQEPRCETA